jgi:Mg-chelatase subunit ChlD
MAALVNALDNYNTLQIGDKGHIEYGWSNSLQEKIAQFSFQIVRTRSENTLRETLTNMLSTLKYKISVPSITEREKAKGYLLVLYKMIGYTRDIVDGKGEYKLTYMMIDVWFNFFPELSRFALKCLVDLGDKSVHQYGSWKDIKYFCDYIKNKNHPIISYAIKLINEQLQNDYANLISNSSEISLAAKWAPRENSSFSWLYERLATDYFSNFMMTPNSQAKIEKAILKCKTEYRKLLSALNRYIDTVQIKQCGNIWSQIDFNKVTSISLSKQKKAFLNTKNNGNLDRIKCAENFTTYIKKAVKGETEMKGKRVSMVDFTKQAMDLFRCGSQVEKDLLNSQWRDNSSQNGGLSKMIAMVDVSGSMEGDPMNAAIALGIRIAEKSALGKRVMTFSQKPTWVNLEPYNDFVSQVKVVMSAEWGMNTNFHAALDTILSAIIQNKLSPEDVQGMVLVVLSDMQMDSGDNCNKQTLYDTMKAKYEAAGIRVHGTPYKPPHILFWNLKSTSGFPTLVNQPNVSMMSGFSPVLLNLFCNEGFASFQSFTPWSILVRSLKNERYKIMEDKFEEIIW